MPFSKISPSLFAPEGHFTESADSLLNAGEYCLVHTPWDFCGNARTSVRATHTHTHTSCCEKTPSPRLSPPQIKSSSPPQWTPRKQFGSQLAAEVVNNHQITVAGTFVENLTPRSGTQPPRSGELHTERCTGEKARAGGEMTAATETEMFQEQICRSCTQTHTHTHTHTHTLVHSA